MTTISVTEVRNALRCPRIFVLGRRAGSQVTFPVGPSSLGATFHRIVARAAETADPPPPRISPPRAIDCAASRWSLGSVSSPAEGEAAAMRKR